MTDIRHRQKAFTSPLEIPEMEIWMPRRDRIFVPSNYPSFRTVTWESLEAAYDRIAQHSYSRYLEDRICSLDRAEFIVPTRRRYRGEWITVRP